MNPPRTHFLRFLLPLGRAVLGAALAAWLVPAEIESVQQQLVGFARILVRKPGLLFLDEATSALDPNNAIAMYDLVRRELPGLTLVSIVHDDRLLAYHDHLLTISAGVASISAIAANEDRP